MNTLLIDPAQETPAATLEADIAAFLDYLTHERRLAENTRLAYARALAKFMAFVDDGGVADYLALQPPEVSRFVEMLNEGGLAAASRKLAITALRLFYRRMVVLDRITAAAGRPVEALATPILPEKLPKVLAYADVNRLLDAPCKRSFIYWRDKSLLEFLYATGCRASEATGLRMDDLDLDAGTARVLGKGAKERIVLLGEPAVQALHAYIHLLRPRLIRHQAEPQPSVFVSKTGEQLDRAYLWVLVHGYAVKAGLPDWVGVHSMRHATATHVLKGGADVRFAQEMLGHAKATVTAVYLHLDTAHLRRVHERFEVYRHGEAAAVETAAETLPSPPAEVPAPRLPIHKTVRSWSPCEDAFVRALPAKEAAEKTGRTLDAVRSRRHMLGITLFCRRWTAAEDELVRTLPIREVVEATGRTRSAVVTRRMALGVARRRRSEQE